MECCRIRNIIFRTFWISPLSAEIKKTLISGFCFRIGRPPSFHGLGTVKGPFTVAGIIFEDLLKFSRAAIICTHNCSYTIYFNSLIGIKLENF